MLPPAQHAKKKGRSRSSKLKITVLSDSQWLNRFYHNLSFQPAPDPPRQSQSVPPPTMLTTAPHLLVRRPSPTTAEFIITTRPALTIPLRLLLLAVTLLRILLGLATLLMLYSRWALSSLSTPLEPYPVAPPLFSDDFIWFAVYCIHTSPLGRIFTQAAAQIPAQILLPCAAAVAYLIMRRVHMSESLLVLRGLGIQTSSTAHSYLGSAATRFIPTEKIQDILINEAFRGFEVRYYLVVVVEGEEDVVVVFPRLLPPKRIVRAVWQGVRGCLFEEEGLTKMDDEKC